MMIIKTRSFPRAALIGNPSDGYNGRTIAFLFSNFSAEAGLYESPEIKIVPAKYDSLTYSSIKDLCKDVELYGYYGGIRLIKATIKVFYNFCIENKIRIDNRNFTIEYRSDIPFGLGLAGSSAIIMATMRGLMKFYYINIPKPILANLVWSVENVELKIAAGLQDRVAQAYEAPVFMDFAKEFMDKQGYGYYETFQADLLPNLYIAYRTDLAEGSEILHNDFRERFHFGDPAVLDAINQWAALTLEVKELLFNGKKNEIAPLLNRNFDIRRQVMKLSQRNIEMVETARAAGGSAKFTGSGGAIIGTYENEEIFQRLSDKLNSINVKVIKPVVVCNLS
jgi:glucuronokinase